MKHPQGSNRFARSRDGLLIGIEELSPNVVDDAFVIPIDENGILLGSSPRRGFLASVPIGAMAGVSLVKGG